MCVYWCIRGEEGSRINNEFHILACKSANGDVGLWSIALVSIIIGVYMEKYSWKLLGLLFFSFIS